MRSRDSELRRQDALESLRSPSSASNADISLLNLDDASEEEKLRLFQRLASDPQIQSSHEAKAIFHSIRSEPVMHCNEGYSSSSDELESPDPIAFQALTSSDTLRERRDSRTIATQTSQTPPISTHSSGGEVKTAEIANSSNDVPPVESLASTMTLTPPNSKTSPIEYGGLGFSCCVL